MSRPFPLTRGQARMLLAERTVPGGADHRVVQVRLLAGPLEADRLRRALADVVARHPVLRTVYGWDDAGAPVQVVLPPDPDRDSFAAVADLPAEPGGDRSELAERAVAPWWDTPFDLEAAPPVRTALLRTGPEEHLLALDAHHIAFDGWSAHVLLRDLGTAYAARLAGREPDWAPVPDMRALQDRESRSLAAVAAADLPFWREVLADLPALPALAVGEAAEEPLEEHGRLLPAAAMADFAARVRRRGGLPLAALVDRTARLLTGDGAAVTLGSVTSGRVDRDLRDTVGCLVNPVLLPVRPAPGGDLRALTAFLLACLQHARTPYDEVARRLRVPAAAAARAVVVLHGATPVASLGPVALRPLVVRAPRTATPLLVELGQRADGSRLLRAQWRAGALAAGTGRALVDDLADHLLHLGTERVR